MFADISLTIVSVLNLHVRMYIRYLLAEVPYESGSVNPFVPSFTVQDFRTGSSVCSEFCMKFVEAQFSKKVPTS